MNSLIRVCLLAVLFASLAYTVSAGNRWERAAIAYRTLPLTFEPRGTEAGSRQQFVTHVAGHRVVLGASRSEEHTSELQSPCNLVCRLLLGNNNKNYISLQALNKEDSAQFPRRVPARS